jgi:hypothetical protein
MRLFICTCVEFGLGVTLLKASRNTSSHTPRAEPMSITGLPLSMAFVVYPHSIFTEDLLEK